MVAGTLEVWLDELQCYVLREGDSFWFPSTHAHRWFNPGDVDAVLARWLLQGCDVLLLDIAMPDQSGIDILRTIRQGQPNLPVLILSGYPAQQYALNLFKMGANGYLNKECEPMEIVNAIRTISLGRRYITPAVAELLARQLDRKDDAAPHEQLSEREFQVFLKLAKGETAGDIAKTLSLSVKTVSTYRTRLMEKMNLSSNSDLTYYALKNKLID